MEKKRIIDNIRIKQEVYKKEFLVVQVLEDLIYDIENNI